MEEGSRFRVIHRLSYIIGLLKVFGHDENKFIDHLFDDLIPRIHASRGDELFTEFDQRIPIRARVVEDAKRTNRSLSDSEPKSDAENGARRFCSAQACFEKDPWLTNAGRGQKRDNVVGRVDLFLYPIEPFLSVTNPVVPELSLDEKASTDPAVISRMSRANASARGLSTCTWDMKTPADCGADVPESGTSVAI